MFEKLNKNHIVINFLDEDGNNTLMLMKDSQSMYIYTDFNNEELGDFISSDPKDVEDGIYPRAEIIELELMR